MQIFKIYTVIEEIIIDNLHQNYYNNNSNKYNVHWYIAGQKVLLQQ